MKTKLPYLFIVGLLFLVLSCNLPTAGASIGTSSPTAAAAPSLPAGATQPSAAGTILATDVSTVTGALPTATVPPLPTLIPTLVPTLCSPNVVNNTSTATNIRTGPGTVFSIIGNLPPGGSAPVSGKVADGSWWVIQFAGGPGGLAWISASVTTANCIPATLASVASPPTPLPPSGTCKDGYVQRLINSSDKVCVPTADKAQSDADNATAGSRLATSTYGPDTCISGYVWRAAFSGDHVCVLPATHTQALLDNAAAASRWMPGGHTCVMGYVWRVANPSDDVCVTVANRTLTALDNAAANSRKSVTVNGVDACMAGYVWRNAFSGDHVCVTTAVQAQVAADNAAAPSHTW